jgi:hypothetical protein
MRDQMSERKRDIADSMPVLIGAAALYRMQLDIYRKIMPSEIICLGKIIL